MRSPPRTAVILAGGPILPRDGLPGSSRPKLLLPMANRPLISYLASALRGAGATRLIVMLDQSAAEARNRLMEIFSNSPFDVECVTQKLPRGTGGSVKAVESLLQEDAFWIVSGDVLLGTDLRSMLDAHRESGSVATVGVLRIAEAPWEMERVEMEGDRVKAIHRIHPAQNKRSMLRPVGLYLFERSVLSLIPDTGYFDLKEQLFPLLHQKGIRSCAWEIPGYCRMIATVADYFTANRDLLLDPDGLSKLDSDLVRADEKTMTAARISSTATLLEPVAIGSSCSVGDGSIIIGPTVVGNNCRIEAGVIIDECILFENVTIGRGARLDRCILAEGSRVQDGSELREMVILDEPMKAGDVTAFPGKHLPLVSSGLLRLSNWRSRARRTYLGGKRIFDLLLSAISLMVASPFLCLIAIAIKLDSPGEILFRQRRCSLNGKEFTMYKFRTMLAKAEELKRGLLLSNDVDGPMFKMLSDPRTTRVGRFLRATNLDELPQLWNVLRGDMSLVGPRPLAMEEMRYSPHWRDLRLLVRPGLTGLWQVEAHTKVSFAEWIRCDLYYAQNLSPWLDFRILFKTLRNSILPSRKGGGVPAVGGVKEEGMKEQGTV